MNPRIEWIGLAIGLVCLALIVELIRKRRLREEYALLWIAATLAIIGLSMQREILHKLAELMGVAYPPMVLPMIAGIFGLLLAVHFSLVISRLSGENKTLAQDVALLRLEVAELRKQAPPPGAPER